MIQLERTLDNIVFIDIPNHKSVNKGYECYDILLKHLMSNTLYLLSGIDIDPLNMIRFRFELDICHIPDGRFSYYVIQHDETDYRNVNKSYVPDSCTRFDCSRIDVFSSGMIEITNNKKI